MRLRRSFVCRHLLFAWLIEQLEDTIPVRPERSNIRSIIMFVEEITRAAAACVQMAIARLPRSICRTSISGAVDTYLYCFYSWHFFARRNSSGTDRRCCVSPFRPAKRARPYREFRGRYLRPRSSPPITKSFDTLNGMRRRRNSRYRSLITARRRSTSSLTLNARNLLALS